MQDRIDVPKGNYRTGLVSEDKKIETDLLPVAVAFEKVTGRRPSQPTLFRWIGKGIKGVRLQAWLLGGRRMTSIAAVNAFIAETNAETIPAVTSECKSEKSLDKSTRTVTIQIGNADDKLSQSAWSQFNASVKKIVEESGCYIHFHGHSDPSAPWQNACFVCVVFESRWSDFIDKLIACRKSYHKDSIAIITGATEFI